MTEIQKEYKKELSRINNLIKRAEKRGFIGYEVETKRPTRASIAELKKMRPDTIYAKMKYTLPTGEVISGTRGREYERKVSVLKSQTRPDWYSKQLSKLFREYGVTEPDIFGEFKEPVTETDGVVYNSEPIGIGGHTSEVSEGEKYYYEFLDLINDSDFPDELATMIMFMLNDMLRTVSIEKLGMALSKLPERIIDYFATVGLDSDEGLRGLSSDIVNYLPISKKNKKVLENAFDAYTVN